MFKFYDGYFLEISGAGLDTLLACRDSLNLGAIDPDSLSEGSNNHQTLGIQIVIFKTGGGGPSSQGCDPKTLRRDADFVKNGAGDRRIKWVLWIENFQLTSGNVHAKTKNYKKKCNGNWKKYRDNVMARCFGKMTDPNGCSQFPFDCQTPTKKAKKAEVPGCVVGLTKANSGDVKGSHIGAGGVTKASVLLF